MANQKNIPYARQSISAEDKEAVIAALDQDIITRGVQVKAFEEAIAAYTGANWAVAFCNASFALYAAFQAAEVTPADRFITSPNSFIATVAAGVRLGATPRFYDIDTETANIDYTSLLPLVQEPFSRGKIVLCPVHFAGIALDMQLLDSPIKAPEFTIIEDAAHALGSCYPDGNKVGSCSHSQMTIFSFHAIKNITTGEGGMVTTNDPVLYEKLRVIRNSGIVYNKPALKAAEAPWYYEVHELSGNYHMNEMQAALGLQQLKRLDQFCEKRRQIVQWYRARLKNCPYLSLTPEHYDERTAYHLFCVHIDFAKAGLTRTGVMEQLKTAGIGSQYHYIPLYLHPAIKQLAFYDEEVFPNMQQHYKTALSLPLYVDLQEEEVAYVAATLEAIVKKKSY